MLDNLLSIDWQRMVSHLMLLAIAFVVALPIGWDRERSRRRFGMRTFLIVAMVSCGFMLVGLEVISSTDGEARVLQGIITGIGFIGGGAILKNGDRVAGTASAASIWNTAASHHFRDVETAANSARTGRGIEMAVIGMFVLALLWTLRAAAPIAMPLVLAFMLYLLLEPIVHALGRGWRAAGGTAARDGQHCL